MENQEFELVFIDDSDTDILHESSDNKINITSYFYNNKFYFVGYEIATLLGYKNTTRTIRDIVSKSNQLEFRDYQGDKEPNLDPRTILITKEGAIEILNKTHKHISNDIINILTNFDIEKKILTTNENKNIEDNDKNDENDMKLKKLTYYSFYNDDGLYFEYFVGYEITSLLGYKSPSSAINKNVSKSNQLEFRDYQGNKEPKLDPRTI
jgi:prophage antirepressor-like protein